MYKSKYLKYKRKYQQLVMTQAIESVLSKEKSFVFVDLPFSKNDKTAIKSINLNLDKSEDYNFYGYYDNLIDNLTGFLQTIGVDDAIATIIKTKIIKPYMTAINKEYMWFVIRATIPTTLFDIPRYHADGYFYKSQEYNISDRPQIKLAGVLKGPSTIFVLRCILHFVQSATLETKLVYI